MNSKRILRGVVLSLFVAAFFIPATSAHAVSATPTQEMKPGWVGAIKDTETGPPGMSVHNNTTISISNVISIVADAGASVGVAIYNTIADNIFGKS